MVKRSNDWNNDSPLVPVDLEIQPDDPDLLVKEYTFSQTFKVAKKDRATFENGIKGYIPYMLDDFGMYFYKGDYTTCVEGESVIVTVNLRLITSKRFTDENYKDTKMTVRDYVDKREPADKYVSSLYDPKAYASRIHILQKSYTRQRKFHMDQLPEGDYAGPDKGLHWSIFSMFIHWWLIVPGVQTDFFGILYQLFAFNLAHQGWVPKYVHFFTIPGNVCFTLAFLCQFPISSHFPEPFTITYGFAFASALALSYLYNGYAKKSIFWGVCTAVACYLLWMVAALFYFAFKVPGAPWYNPTNNLCTNPLILMYTTSLIEAFSHIVVPQLPPYIVGVNHWFDTLKFFFEGNKLYIFFSLISSLTFSPLVSYISWPHLIGDMSIYTLLCLGYHPQFYDEYVRVVTKSEVTGNPAMDRIPVRFKDLIHGMPGNSGTPHKVGIIGKILSFFQA